MMGYSFDRGEPHIAPDQPTGVRWRALGRGSPRRNIVRGMSERREGAIESVGEGVAIPCCHDSRTRCLTQSLQSTPFHSHIY